jgi:hypothetical protein
MLIMIGLFILAVTLGPLLYSKVANQATNSPDRSSRITGTWVGRAVLSNQSSGRWDMPAEGTGDWVVMIQSKHRLFTSMDATQGTVTLCSNTGARTVGTFNMGFLNGGEADLNVEQTDSTLATRIDLAFLSPRDGKMFFSASVAEEDMRGILEPGQPADFERLCK